MSIEAQKTVERQPFEKVLSPNVTLFYGFKDAHAVIRICLPVVRVLYPVEIPAEAIVKFKKNFDDAYAYGIRPEAERDMKGPIQFEARHDCRGRWGYKDAHVELDAWRLMWFKLDFPFEEFLLAKEAMDAANLWAQLPEHVRAMQGAP
jgi:hypothetical protein